MEATLSKVSSFKVHHLATELYADPTKIFRVHLGIRQQQQCLINEVAAQTAGLIRGYLAKHAIPTHAWMILPSRISFIIQPTKHKTIFAISSDLKKIIKKRALPESATFYDDFLDHVLRRTEDPKATSAELFSQIPLLGLAASPSSYPFCGSHLYTKEELSIPTPMAVAHQSEPSASVATSAPSSESKKE